MNLRYRTLLVYIAKCVAGIILCYYISALLKTWVDYAWFLISVILVLSPEGKDAVELSLTRIKANLVGAGTGIIVLLSQIPSPWNVAAGAVISLVLCDQLKLNAGARSTLTAVIIILLHPEGAHFWDSALSRIVAVIVGSLLGLLITYVFHSIFKINEPVLNSEAVKEEKGA
jgi:uncharacterized membrane protein YgaE (UPF0421/DUF939 family)